MFCESESFAFAWKRSAWSVEGSNGNFSLSSRIVNGIDSKPRWRMLSNENTTARPWSRNCCLNASRVSARGDPPGARAAEGDSSCNIFVVLERPPHLRHHSLFGSFARRVKVLVFVHEQRNARIVQWRLWNIPFFLLGGAASGDAESLQREIIPPPSYVGYESSLLSSLLLLPPDEDGNESGTRTLISTTPESSSSACKRHPPILARTPRTSETAVPSLPFCPPHSP